MKKLPLICLLLLLLMSCLSGYAQDTTNPARFVSVELKSNIIKGKWRLIDFFSCTAYFSNDSTKDMAKVLGLVSPEMLVRGNSDGDLKHYAAVHQNEFKLLSWFYDRGYELISKDWRYDKYLFRLK